MGLIRNLGKLLLVAALLGQAYLVLVDPTESKNFGTKFTTLSKNPQFGFLKQHEKHSEIVRLVVGGLLASSILLLLSKSCLFTLLAILGVIGNALIMTNPLTETAEPGKTIAFIGVMKSVATIGGLLILCCSQGGKGKSCLTCSSKSKNE